MEEQPEMTQGEAVEPVEDSGAQDGGAEQVTIDSTMTFGASAKENLTMNASLAFGVAAGRDMSASDSVSVATAVGHDLKLTDSAAVFMTVGNSVQVENGGSAVILCRELTTQNASLGMVIAQQTNLGEGSKIMLNVSPQQAAIFGAVFGAVVALFGWLLRRK